ncbi:MAG: hypothetical protein HFH88_15700 [Lachnospiraceae bacterium]|jgi:hypothetical protein|nr:hypothetical protein [Lachnospiraceae bacterium]
MKRKNLLAVVLIAVMMSGGCGNKEAETATGTDITESSEVEVSQESEPPISSEEVKQEEITASPEPADTDSLITEKTDDDLDFFYLDDNQRFAGVEDALANSKTREQAKAEPAEAPVDDKPAEAPVDDEPVEVPVDAEPAEAPVDDEPVEVPVDDKPAEAPVSDKYTPEEAIAVYRSLMEAGGITWDPSLKGNWDETIGKYPIEDWNLHMDGYNGCSWGTGWIYLEKGQPEWCAETDLESFAIGNSGGISWTKYYLEVTGSDDECVNITAWHN